MKRKMKDSPFFKRWTWMRHITRNPNHPEYHRYGGRGVELHFHDLWHLEEYVNTKLGAQPTPDHQLCRINKQGHFAPKNLQWQLPVERSNGGTQQNIKAKYKNRSQTLANWARELDLPYWTLRRRIAEGMTIKEIVKEYQ